MARVTLWGFLNWDPTLFDDIELPEACDKDTLINTIIQESGELYPYYQQPAWLKKNISFWFSRMKRSFERSFEALNVEYSPIENYDRYEEYTDTGSKTFSEIGKETKEGGSTLTGENGQTISKNETNTASASSSSSGTTEGTVTNNGSNTNTISAMNAETYQPDSKVENVSSGTNNGSNTAETESESEATITGTDTVNGTESQTVSNNEETNSEASSEEATNLSHTAHLHGNIGTLENATMILHELELRKYDIYLEIARQFEKRFMVQVY